jgi:hypothetical protein
MPDPGERQLILVVLADRATGTLPYPLDSREQEPHEHGDDRDDDKQFHERETASAALVSDG